MRESFPRRALSIDILPETIYMQAKRKPRSLRNLSLQMQIRSWTHRDSPRADHHRRRAIPEPRVASIDISKMATAAAEPASRYTIYEHDIYNIYMHGTQHNLMIAVV